LIHVFAKRCYTIGRSLNLTTEENFEEAFILAELRDKERLEAIKNKTTDQLPPLHGIPISVKDLIR
jgi:Asp-tRNA(Asn)/Glu-tRNA(Gln) amidotransferase A subunit family amidase